MYWRSSWRLVVGFPLGNKYRELFLFGGYHLARAAATPVPQRPTYPCTLVHDVALSHILIKSPLNQEQCLTLEISQKLTNNNVWKLLKQGQQTRIMRMDSSTDGFPQSPSSHTVRRSDYLLFHSNRHCYNSQAVLCLGWALYCIALAIQPASQGKYITSFLARP